MFRVVLSLLQIQQKIRTRCFCKKAMHFFPLWLWEKILWLFCKLEAELETDAKIEPGKLLFFAEWERFLREIFRDAGRITFICSEFTENAESAARYEPVGFNQIVKSNSIGICKGLLALRKDRSLGGSNCFGRAANNAFSPVQYGCRNGNVAERREKKVWYIKPAGASQKKEDLDRWKMKYVDRICCDIRYYLWCLWEG